MVAAVDVGILNLTNYKPPAPDEYYLGQRQLSAEVRDLYGQLIDGMQGTRGQIRTGGDAGAELNGSPPSQAPLALYSGIVEVRSGGRPRSRSRFPAFAGTVRVMAVAWSKDKVGRASGDVIVRDPVVLTATLPRFLLTGDKSTMNLDLDNVEGAAGAYNLTVSAEGTIAIGEGGQEPAASRQAARPRHRAAQRIGCRRRRPSRSAIKGPGDFALERSYVMNVKPATQVLARRTVKPIAKGESLTLSSDLFADLVPGTGTVAVSVGVSTALDAASLLKALDRYPYGCSEQITSRAMPLLYVNELASAAHLALDDAIDQRIRDAIDRVLARQSSNGSFGLWGVGGDDAWLDAYVTDFLTRARERGFAVPDVGVQARARPPPQHRRHRADAPRTAAAISPTRSTCWRGTARRRSAICAISPTPSSTISARPLPRRRSPRRWACSATASAPSGSTRRRSTISSRRAQTELFSREDYGSQLRDAAALVTLASEAGGSRPTIVNAVAKIEQARARAPYTSTQENAWLVLAARAMAKDSGGVSLDVAGDNVKGALYRSRQGGRAVAAAEGDQHRRRRAAGRGLGVGRADHAGAGGGERLQDRAATITRSMARTPIPPKPSRTSASSWCSRSPSPRRSSAACWSPIICRRASRSITRSSSRRARPAPVVDRERQGAGVFGVPRRAVQSRRSSGGRRTRRCSRSPMWCARCRPAATCCRRPMSRTCTGRTASGEPGPARSRSRREMMR